MKTEKRKINLTVRSLATMLGLATVFATAGCATKRGPTQVYATPVQRTVSPLNQAIADAPRTQPGKIMDPEALTYAQVPSRIIYLPGDHGIAGRKSARQEVAYNLVPVSRIGAIQAEATPEFGEVIVQKETTRVEDITEMSFIESDGSTSRGRGRRLGVLGKSGDSEERASNLLKKGEELKWDSEVGWVGFVVDKKAKPYTPKQSKTNDAIKELELAPKKETPKIDNLESRKTEEIWKEEAKEAEEDISLDLDTKTNDEPEKKVEEKKEVKEKESEEIELSFE